VLQADYVATGHYARIEAGTNGLNLKKGLDAAKDQSYVLYGMGQEELKHSLMPVGAYAKDEIRRMAHEANFPNAGKPDSQDICFIPFGDYKAFLQERVATAPGDIVDTAGNILGRHGGIELFTIGQRRGLGLPGGDALYVLGLEPETNRVVVGPEAGLYRDRFWVSRVKFVAGTPPAGRVQVGVKIRYRAEEAQAVLEPAAGGAMIQFERPQRAITPGQAAVFYQGDLVLGGGIIEGDRPQ
jgi:tRNA-specific 2-thiouridylase